MDDEELLFSLIEFGTVCSEILDTHVTINVTLFGKTYEVVHWVDDEWEEDSSLTPTIANAVMLCHANPGLLLKISLEHIKSQMVHNVKYNGVD